MLLNKSYDVQQYISWDITTGNKYFLVQLCIYNHICKVELITLGVMK